MVGGRDYAESQLNRVTDARRQPGSTFSRLSMQPLQDGMSPVQTFSDAPRVVFMTEPGFIAPPILGRIFPGRRDDAHRPR